MQNQSIAAAGGDDEAPDVFESNVDVKVTPDLVVPKPTHSGIENNQVKPEMVNGKYVQDTDLILRKIE